LQLPTSSTAEAWRPGGGRPLGAGRARSQAAGPTAGGMAYRSMTWPETAVSMLSVACPSGPAKTPCSCFVGGRQPPGPARCHALLRHPGVEHERIRVSRQAKWAEYLFLVDWSTRIRVLGRLSRNGRPVDWFLFGTYPIARREKPGGIGVGCGADTRTDQAVPESPVLNSRVGVSRRVCARPSAGQHARGRICSHDSSRSGGSGPCRCLGHVASLARGCRRIVP